VVAEDGEMRAEAVMQTLDDRDSGLEMCVRAYGLIEDHKIIGRGLEGVIEHE
jgi:hypothetical protein